jgi:hypothetical protein
MGDGTWAQVVAAVANSTSNSSTQRVTAGALAPGQTAKQSAGSVVITTAQTVTINAAVTAGKTFYITDIHLATNDSTTAGGIGLQIQAAGSTIFQTNISSTAPCDMSGIETAPFATAGQAVTLVTTLGATGKAVSWFISGFEQ